MPVPVNRFSADVRLRRILDLLLEGVDYRDGKLGLRFRPAGIRTLAEEATSPVEATS
jgi:hypothetical protein